jgi:hypothetical protein
MDFCSQVDNALALQLGLLPAPKSEAAYRFCAGRSGTWPRHSWGAAIGNLVINPKINLAFSVLTSAATPLDGITAEEIEGGALVRVYLDI